MSFIYSQALVEASSLGKCLDTEQSVPSSGNHTRKLSLWHDKTMEPSRLSRFGMTCKLLTADLGAELLTSWLAAFRAKTYPSPEKAQESTERAAECGSTWRGWLAKYDPDTSLWKTAQCSFIEDSTECLATLPRSGMTRDGLLWELPMLERRTSVTGFGFWPLSRAVKMWPTPNAMPGTSDLNFQCSGDGREKPNKLGWAVAKAMEYNSRPLSEQVGGQLNPNWVEWLMGWPIGHTDLKPLETDRFPNVQQKPSDFCLEVCE